MQALSRALTDSPDVNATLQSDMKAVIRHRHHNIGVAIATPTGLVVRITNSRTLAIRIKVLVCPSDAAIWVSHSK